jgi:hypothetical protein
MTTTNIIGVGALGTMTVSRRPVKQGQTPPQLGLAINHVGFILCWQFPRLCFLLWH